MMRSCREGLWGCGWQRMAWMSFGPVETHACSAGADAEHGCCIDDAHFVNEDEFDHGP